MGKIDDKKLEEIVGGKIEVEYLPHIITYSVKKAEMTLNDIFTDFRNQEINYKQSEVMNYFGSVLGCSVNPNTIIPRGVYNRVPVYQTKIKEIPD